MDTDLNREVQNALSIGMKIVEGHNQTKLKILEMLKDEQEIEIKKLYLEHIVRIDKSLDDKLNSVDDIEYKVLRTRELIEKQIKKEKKNYKKLKKREKKSVSKGNTSNTLSSTTSSSSK